MPWEAWVLVVFFLLNIFQAIFKVKDDSFTYDMAAKALIWLVAMLAITVKLGLGI